MKNSNQVSLNGPKVIGQIEIPEEPKRKRVSFNPGWDTFTPEDHNFFQEMDQEELAIYYFGYVPDKDKMFSQSNNQ